MKFTALLGNPAAVTTTLPEVAVPGTVTRMLDAVQLVTGAETSLKVTVAGAVPKLVPAIVTSVPVGPFAGLRLEMSGDAGRTVKFTPLLD